MKQGNGMDAKKAEKKITAFIRGYFKSSKKKTAVIGLSGGLDSAATLALCVRALGRRRVVAVLMPSFSTPAQDMSDAKALAKKLGVKTIFHGIEPALAAFGALSSGRLSRANLSARIRMAILYSIAQQGNGLVVGTGDKSEFLLGYFTKYGDGGADLFPIGGLYKTEVRKLASHLGVPARIISKPSSPALWGGQTAESELGFTYEAADVVLAAIGRGETRSAIEKKFGKKIVRAIISRMEKNRHKLIPAPICDI
ncbi:MAG: NAD+ synthase [Candidatus Micrarchaeia archaeon]